MGDSDKKQETGLKREKSKNFDKFYTNLPVVELCMNKIIEHIVFEKDDLIIEPSAGDGSFINSIKQISNNYKFFDILPDHPDIIKQDFLEYDFNEI